MKNTEITKTIINLYNGDNKVNYNMKQAAADYYNSLTKEQRERTDELMAAAMRSRSAKNFINHIKMLSNLAEEMEAEKEEDTEMNIEQALGYAIVSFDTADARNIEVEEYKCTTKNKSIIKFYHCGFDFRIERDDDNDICWIEYALTGYEFKDLFGLPLHNQGYNFLTGQVDTDKHYMTNLEIIAMILKNMVNNDYIGAYLDETETEEAFIKMMEGDE